MHRRRARPIDPATGLVTIPTDAAVQATVTVTATNSGGSATSAFQVTVEAEERPLRPRGGGHRDPGLGLAAGGAGDLVHPGAALPRPRRRDRARDRMDDEHQGPGSGFPVQRGEEDRRHLPALHARSRPQSSRRDPAGRLQRLEGRRAPPPRVALPLAPHRPGAMVPARARSSRCRAWRAAGCRWSRAPRRQFEAKEIGGPGMQFLRDFATSPAAPNLLLCPMDQNFPWASDDFGKSFYTPNWNGMWVGRSGVSAWIDPQDASRQLLLYSAGSQSFDEDFDAYSGLYRSIDGGKTAERVLSLPMLIGTTYARHNMRLIAHAPGGTPDTRTIYVMQVSHGPEGPDAATIQLWVSSKGGAAGSWSKRGSALPAATYADGKHGHLGHRRRAERRSLRLGREGRLAIPRRLGGSRLDPALEPAGQAGAPHGRRPRQGRGLGRGRGQRPLQGHRRRDLHQERRPRRLQGHHLRHLARRSPVHGDHRQGRGPDVVARRRRELEALRREPGDRAGRQLLPQDGKAATTTASSPRSTTGWSGSRTATSTWAARTTAA